MTIYTATVTAPATGTPAAPRRPQRRGEERRRQIVEAAIATVEVRGVRGTSMADVARRAGITAQGVLYHFKTKEALVSEVVVELERRREEELRVLVEPGGLGMLRALAQVGERVAHRQHLAALNVAVAAENLEPGDPYHRFFAGRRRLDQALLRRGLRRGIASGELRADTDVAGVAEEMTAFMGGAWLNWLLEPSRVAIGRLYRRYFADLERRLSA